MTWVYAALKLPNSGGMMIPACYGTYRSLSVGDVLGANIQKLHHNSWVLLDELQTNQKIAPFTSDTVNRVTVSVFIEAARN